MKTKQRLIFILHGWSQDLEKWSNFLLALENRGFSPKMLKIPGLTSKLTEAWLLDDYVKWLENQLTGIDKVNIIAHSFGARIAIKFAAKYPKRIHKLILISAAGIKDKSIRATIRRNVFLIASKIGKIFTTSNYFRKIIYKLARERDYLEAQSFTKETMKNIINEDLTDILYKIKVSTCIIWGKNDRVTPLKNAYLFHKEIKNNQLFLIEDAKHSPQFSQPGQIANIVNEFIS